VLDMFKIAHPLTDIELICYLRPTTPFRALYHIEQAIKEIRAAGDNATGLRSVEVMAESAYKCYELDNYLYPVLPMSGINMTDWPNQDCPPTYKPNGHIDICKPKIIATGKLWGDKIIGYLTPRTIEIDTKEDLEYAWYWLRWCSQF
jgi:CMP-N-acetylneuraminic acid synthetase